MMRCERLFGIDLRGLAAFRIALGALLLADLVYRCVDFRAHYTEAGILPRELHRALFTDAAPAWSIHLISGATAFPVALFALAFAAALALLVGWRPRASALVSWILLVSVQNRQPLILHGGDMILLLLLFWSMLLPLPERGFLRRAAREPAPARITVSFASAGLLVQVALVYAFAALFKLQDPAWRGLTAIEETFHVEGVATAFASALLAWPDLLATLTAATLLAEASVPLLAFSPWKTGAIRTALALSMIVFHLLGTGTTMRLGLVEYAMSAAWIPFLPPQFWDRAVLRGRRSEPAVVRAPSAGLALDGFALLALALVVANNFASLDLKRVHDPAWGWLHVPTRALALSQNWRLWSTPLHNRYYVFLACLDDGSLVDLHTGRALDWDRPRPRSRNNHWWKYQLHALGSPGGEQLLPAYAAHLAREWRREHPDNPVATIRMFRIDVTRPGRSPSEQPRAMLWGVRPQPGHRCADG